MGRKDHQGESTSAYPAPVIAVDDNVLNAGYRVSEETGDKERAYFRKVEGLPVPEYVLEYWKSDLHVELKEFVWADVVYQIATVKDADDGKTVNILQSLRLEPEGNGRVEPAAEGYPPICVVSFTDHWVAATCTGMDEYYVDDVWQNPEDGAFDEWKNQTSNELTCVGLGRSGLEKGDKVVFLWAWSEQSESDAIDRLKAAYDGWEKNEREMIGFWMEKLKPCLSVDERLRYYASVAVGQILAHICPDGFMPAAWLEYTQNFMRDTSWTAFGLVHFCPEEAKKILEWFAGASSIANNLKRDYTDGVGNPTDYAAVFLITIGEYYKVTGDLTLIESLKTRIDECVSWAKQNYVAADKHILAAHPHDFWDDYTRLSAYSKKYESLIDVLWAEALRRAAVFLNDYGDSDDASWCEETSKALIEGLEDYRTPDGGFWYCITTDDELVREYTSSAALYSALFFGDHKAWSWLVKNQYRLKFSTLPFTCITNFEETPESDTSWMPHVILSSYLSIKFQDDWSPMIDALNITALGILPEGAWAEDGGFIFSGETGAARGGKSFPWTYGFLLYAAAHIHRSTLFDRILRLHGETVTIHRNIPEEKDETGNYVENWLEIGSEKAIIRVLDAKEKAALPGVFVSADARGYFKPSSLIKTGDRIAYQNSMFHVGSIRTVHAKNRIHHLEVELKRVLENE